MMNDFWIALAAVVHKVAVMSLKTFTLGVCRCLLFVQMKDFTLHT